MAAIAELFALMLQLVAEWLTLVFQGLWVLVQFLFSRSFRAKRIEQWRLRPATKVLDLGVAGLWVALAFGLPAFVLISASRQPAPGEAFEPTLVRSGTNEDLRVQLKLKRTNHAEMAGTVVVRKGGIGKILETRSLPELKTQLLDNVSFIRASATNTPPPNER